ncbi:MAG TPA: signal peptidase I, partial [Nocardioides sp.]
MSGQPDKLPVVAAWSRVLVVLGARAYRSLLLALVVIAVAPLAVGWGAYVVKSGSMEPSIAVGDVTLARPLEAGDKVRVGRVFVFDDPSSRTERTLVHRIVELRDDGDYTTAGDANNLTDVTPLPRGAVDSQAVLLVPWVGLPVVWMQTDQWLKLLLALLFTIAAFVVATRNLDGEPPKWTMLRVVRDPGDRQSQRRRPRRRASGVGRSVIPAVAATTALIFVGASATTAGAAFTDRTLNGASNWRAGQGHQPYVAAVLAD